MCCLVVASRKVGFFFPIQCKLCLQGVELVIKTLKLAPQADKAPIEVLHLLANICDHCLNVLR